MGMSADDRDGVGCGRIPFDEYHLDVAVQHYQDLALTSGLSLPQYASAIARDRGFLDDHEYAFDPYELRSPLQRTLTDLCSFRQVSVPATRRGRGVKAPPQCPLDFGFRLVELCHAGPRSRAPAVVCGMGRGGRAGVGAVSSLS